MQIESGREIKVAIGGGGISGLTAALRLAQRGYKVTLYEQRPWLGGNLGSHSGDIVPQPRGTRSANILTGEGAWHDVYSHMYPEFYVNFWDIVENDLGMRRDHSDASDFEPHYSLQFVGGDGKFRSLRDAWDPRSLRDNLTTGIHQASPLDMFLFFYSFLDLVCHEFGDIGPLSESVNAFIRSRPWATKQVAALHDFLIMLVWGIHATGTEAVSYQKFIHSVLGNATPLLWLLKGNLQEKLIGPLEQKLLALGCDIKRDTAVTSVNLVGDSVRTISTASGVSWNYENQILNTEIATEKVVEVDYLILAVPPKSLGELAVSGPSGARISDHAPNLSHAGARLAGAPIATLDLYFTRKLEGIPRDNVACTDSDLYFSFIDISQLWDRPEMKGITAVTLAVSDYWAFAGNDNHENAYQMIRQFHRIVPQFDPGKNSPDIDHQRSFYSTNEKNPLFLNQVGSMHYRPRTCYPGIRNLFFAGDFCQNDCDMATVEAAVTSGLNAAKALQQVAPLGAPIKKILPPQYSKPSLRMLKLHMAPYAYAAKHWLTTGDALAHASSRNQSREAIDDVVSLNTLPYAYAADWLETLGSFWHDFQSL